MDPRVLILILAYQPGFAISLSLPDLSFITVLVTGNYGLNTNRILTLCTAYIDRIATGYEYYARV